MSLRLFGSVAQLVAPASHSNVSIRCSTGAVMLDFLSLLPSMPEMLPLFSIHLTAEVRIGHAAATAGSAVALAVAVVVVMPPFFGTLGTFCVLPRDCVDLL